MSQLPYLLNISITEVITRSKGYRYIYRHRQAHLFSDCVHIHSAPSPPNTERKGQLRLSLILPTNNRKNLGFVLNDFLLQILIDYTFFFTVIRGETTRCLTVLLFLNNVAVFILLKSEGGVQIPSFFLVFVQ